MGMEKWSACHRQFKYDPISSLPQLINPTRTPVYHGGLRCTYLWKSPDRRGVPHLAKHSNLFLYQSLVLRVAGGSRARSGHAAEQVESMNYCAREACGQSCRVSQ
jgi:hypothetical protein